MNFEPSIKVLRKEIAYLELYLKLYPDHKQNPEYKTQIEDHQKAIEKLQGKTDVLVSK